MLLYHATFYVDKGGSFFILSGSDVQASDFRPSVRSVGQMLRVLSATSKYRMELHLQREGARLSGWLQTSLSISSTAVP